MAAAADADADADAVAELALRVLAVDPAGLGGVRLRAQAGPARDGWLAALRAALADAAPWRRIAHAVDDEQLLGGLDLAATLRTGRVVARAGVLAEADGGVLLLAMAERCAAGTAARIAEGLDAEGVCAGDDAAARPVPPRFALVALDEAVADDATLPTALADRLAIDLRLDERPASRGLALDPMACTGLDGGATRADVERARTLLPGVQASEAIVTALCEAACQLGIASLRAPWLALRVARVVAALAGRLEVGATDAAWAARLVLGPRARTWPDAAPPGGSEAEVEPAEAAGPAPGEAADAAPHTETEPATEPTSSSAPDPDSAAMSERVVDACAATLPRSLLDAIAAGLSCARAPAGGQGRSGAARRSATRGRPIGSQRGPLRGGARLDLLQTLRAAAPWQALRRRESPVAARPGALLVRGEDIHVRRYRERRQGTTIFAVDASGSQALNRLAETKGAVELLLADCYVRRDQVALVAFCGTKADVILPPTRSLVRAKRLLGGLPGGGGTPLASGIAAAHGLASTIARGGGTPLLVLLTDGSANVGLDGAAGRARAGADALAAARRWGGAAFGALLVDTAQRPQPLAAALARAMDARYVALPDAEASTIARAIGAAADKR